MTPEINEAYGSGEEDGEDQEGPKRGQHPPDKDVAPPEDLDLEDGLNLEGGAQGENEEDPLEVGCPAAPGLPSGRCLALLTC